MIRSRVWNSLNCILAATHKEFAVLPMPRIGHDSPTFCSRYTCDLPIDLVDQNCLQEHRYNEAVCYAFVVKALVLDPPSSSMRFNGTSVNTMKHISNRLSYIACFRGPT